MLKYKIRKRWRHFKYRLLRLFFPERDLNRILDINKLDFVDAVQLIQIKAEKWLTVEEYNFFKKADRNKYGLEYELARQMADVLAKYVEVSEIFDMDEEKYLTVGAITLAKRRENGSVD